MSRARRRSAVVAILAVVLTSCGGGDDDDAASTQAPTTGPSTTRASASAASSAPPLENPAPGRFAECAGAEQPVLSAFDAATGAERWTTCGDAGRHRSVVGADDQRAFIVEQSSNPTTEAASRPSALVALNPADGVEQWRFERSGRLAVPPGTFAFDDVIVVRVSAADGEELVGIDATSGEARWSEPLDVGQRAVASSPSVVVVDRGVDATTTTAGPDGRPPTPTSTWVGLDRRSGAELWSADIGLDDGGGAPPSAAADETTIVVTSPTLMALDAATGAVRWTSPSGRDDAAVGRIVAGVLLTGGQGVDVVARSVDTGDVRWTRPGSTPSDDVWAVTEGAVVVRDGEELVSYAVADGVERWRQPTNAESYAWPWLGHDDVLYAMWWNLEARSAADGSLRWVTDHPVGAEPSDATPRMTSVARVEQLLVVAYTVGATGGE